MIQIFDVPSRQYNNRDFTTSLLKLSQHVNMTTYWFVLCRMEIEIVAVGSTLSVSYEMLDGSGGHLGGSSAVYTQPGRYEIGFSRGDLDEFSDIIFTITLSGRMTLNAILYIAERGEDILEWI